MSEQVSKEGTQKIRGRVNVHFNPQRQTYRLRFTGAHQDQVETMQQALALARAIAGTTYDTVALEHICLDFIAGASQ